MDATHDPAERHPIAYWLKLVGSMVQQNVDTVLGSAAITRRHWQILEFLHEKSATYAEIDDEAAPFLAPHMPTVRPIVDDLCSRDWATQVSSDRVTLTEIGTKAHADVAARLAASREHITAGIDTNDYDVAVDVLRRMAVNLGWSEVKDMGPV